MRRGGIVDMGVRMIMAKRMVMGMGVVVPMRMAVGMVVLVGVGRGGNHARDVIL